MVGHTGCSMKLDKSGTSLRCNRCVSTNITGIIRFRVELADDDGNDCATFCVSPLTTVPSPSLQSVMLAPFAFTLTQSCTSNPTAVVDGEDGQLTASASNTVEGVKIEMGVDCRERKQPQNAPVNDSFKSIILSTHLPFMSFKISAFLCFPHFELLLSLASSANYLPHGG
ncbi:unnamed protein product [Brassica rapa subsp. narinosa]